MNRIFFDPYFRFLFAIVFIHLNCHSHYSFLAGADRIDALVAAARRMPGPALALTDTNGLYGAVPFQQAARTAGIRPIFGVEVDQPETANLMPPQRAVLLAKNLKGFGELCRIITDRHLECLQTQTADTESCNPHHRAQSKRSQAGSSVTLAEFSLGDRLRACSDDVIILSPDRHLLDTIARARGGGNLYAELTAHDHRWSASTRKRLIPNPATHIIGRNPNAHKRGPASRWRDWRLLAFAQKRGLPVVATNRVFFIRPKDWQVHRLLSAIRTHTTVHTLPPGAAASPDAWLKPPAEMARLFDDIPEAVHNTLRIAERCDVSLELGRTKLPPFDLPADETAASLLRRLSHEGMRRQYSGTARDAARVRLENELAVIHRLKLEPYFLIVWDIVREAAARGIPTVGRGSAANSLVCRTLNITEVDPLRYNLYFERFLSLERSDYPDIDIDFPWNRRDEMLDYVFDTYGHEHVALISTHVHFRSRSLIREVGKALGVPVPEIDAFTRTLPHFSSLAELETVRETVPECRHLPMEDEPYRTILELSRRIEGFPRHLSIHCGGIVISPLPITDFIPLQKTPKGFAVTQYDMYPVEDMGLLKIDLLAQKGLAVLSDTVKDVQANYGVTIDFNCMDPVTDPKTRALVKAGRTIGCFYIESPGMRNLLQKLGVETFEMLTAASSIIRPGVSDSGMMKAFIDRHNGREAVRYLHPKLEPILNETFGVMIYQEDVIKVAHAIAGMSLGEAEGLRKCMSKKRDWEAMENYRERFVTGALANGVTPDIAQELWRQMESFAGYAFCKAHSASFARVSYQTAWLKAHYPAEFMAAVLSNQGGFYDTCAYVEEARRLGLTLLPPDINESEYRFIASTTPPSPHPSPLGGEGSREESPQPPLQGGAPLSCNPHRQAQPNISSRRSRVRVGLMQVKHLSRNTIDSILEQRKNRPYASLEDFLSRVDIGESEAESLIRCGAMDTVECLHTQRADLPSGNSNHRAQREISSGRGPGPSRPQLLWQLKLIMKSAMRIKHFTCDGQQTFQQLWNVPNVTLKIPPAPFKREERNHPSPQPVTPWVLPRGGEGDRFSSMRVPQYSRQEKLWAELECLDLTVSEHLLALYGVEVAGSGLTVSEAGLGTRRTWPRSVLPIIAARDLSQHAGRLVTLVGWMITAKRTRTVKRELMKFMTLEDPTACFEVTLFPKIYHQFGVLIHDRGPYIVRGRVERDGKCCTLTALWLSRL